MALVLDSDAVVGFLDRGDALHDAADTAIRDLLRHHRLLVSVVTYAEVLTGTRLGHHEEDRVAGFFAQLISEVIPVDVAVAEAAATLRAQVKSLRMPDALILAAAETHPDVELILTGDAKADRIPGLGVRVQRIGSSSGS